MAGGRSGDAGDPAGARDLLDLRRAGAGTGRQPLFARGGSIRGGDGKKLPPGASWRDNAGMVHGQGAGAFVTGDLCPSHKPLDRAFLQELEKEGAPPAALSISGLWLAHHHEDFLWLRREKAEGRLKFLGQSQLPPSLPGQSGRWRELSAHARPRPPGRNPQCRAAAALSPIAKSPGCSFAFQA